MTVMVGTWIAFPVHLSQSLGHWSEISPTLVLHAFLNTPWSGLHSSTHTHPFFSLSLCPSQTYSFTLPLVLPPVCPSSCLPCSAHTQTYITILSLPHISHSYTVRSPPPGVLYHTWVFHTPQSSMLIKSLNSHEIRRRYAMYHAWLLYLMEKWW